MVVDSFELFVRYGHNQATIQTEEDQGCVGFRDLDATNISVWRDSVAKQPQLSPWSIPQMLISANN
jgi:hypothetical protein